MTVTVIDYGAGNLASVVKGLRAVETQVSVTRTTSEVEKARALVIPGVGHFGATRALDSAWRSAIQGCIDRGGAVLGICLGMQWLYEGSTEEPGLSGLGIFAGMCHRIDPADVRLKVPHVGWNTLDIVYPGSKDPGLRPMLSPGLRQAPPGLPPSVRSPGSFLRSPGSLDPGSPNTYAYFTHSYAAPVTPDTVATTTHGTTFAATVARGRVWGTQWHPEKSGETGIQLLRDFVASAAEER